MLSDRYSGPAKALWYPYPIAPTYHQIDWKSVLLRPEAGSTVGGLMPSIQSFKDLKVWQQSMDVTVEAYRITSSFPKAEIFGLTSQIRRAAASVPANIAEGWGHHGTKEFIQFLRVAQGSLNERETHLILAQRLNYLPTDQRLLQQIETTSRMLLSLVRSLQRRMPLEK